MKFKQVSLLIITLLISTNYVVVGQCSGFYGMTSNGGKFNGGTIFQTTGYGDSLNAVFSPVISGGGTVPYGGLCKASNGKFYGTTSSGGANYVGVLYEWDPLTREYKSKYDFDGTETGGWPENALMQASNGKLYGLAQGGAHNKGVLYEWDPVTDTYTKKIDFGTYWGSDPVGTLVQANNGKLYGMTRSGGYNYKGLIYEWDPETNAIRVVFSFDGAVSGNNVVGSLAISASGKLYGMTSKGGTHDLGVLFELDPETGTFTKLLDFNGTDTGSLPYGSPMIADNNRLYGLTSAGGTGNGGVLFEFDLATNQFSKKFDFDYWNGINPNGSLMQAGNGKLYGTTAMGGYSNRGVLFEWDPVAGVFTTKFNFHDHRDPSDRSRRSALIEGNDGNLYGLSSDGGQAGVGEIYEWNFGTGDLEYRFDFYYAPEGTDLSGSLIQASNGKLYGTAYSGGIGSYGVLFEWDPTAKIYSKKIDLAKIDNGRMPFSLMQAKNGRFYGTTLSGGANGQGVIFEWDMQANTYTKKIDFNQSQTGAYPRGSLIQADNGKMFGLTQFGRGIDGGVLFEWDPETNIYINRVEFTDGENGFWPKGSPLLAKNGKIYGTTERGGIYEGGVLFEWDPVKEKYTKKHDFDISGYYPDGTLIQGFDGKLYGMTNGGGASGVGILFEYDLQSNTFSKKLDLASVIGGRKLLGYLFQASNGKIYGMAYAEGNTFGGVLFEYDPVTNSAIKKFEFTKKSGTTPSSKLIEIGNKRSFSILNETACDKYNFNGKILTASGTYYDTIPNAAGCDSLITLNLTLLKSSISTLSATACSAYQFNGRLLKTSGTYFDKIPNAAGCDSIIVLFLTILQPTSSALSIIACDEFQFGNKLITRSGVYVDTLVNSAGCDSVITLHLTIHHRTSSAIYVSACNSYTSPSGKYTLTTGGTYTDTIPNAAGCDSVITIDLQVDHVDTSVIRDRSVLISKDIGANHQWIDCDNGNTPIDGETFLTYTAHKNGHYAVIVSQGVCVDTSAVYEILLTGFTDPASIEITLYPNPTSGNFTIDLGRVYPDVMITITRYDAEVIKTERIFNSRIVDLNMDEPPGIYTVNIITDRNNFNFKVIKQ
jgi:uncharacterized repeat protein (TIGR03803 family)